MVIKNLTVIEINAALLKIQKEIEELRQLIQNLSNS
jgi:hypothetical protein